MPKRPLLNWQLNLLIKSISLVRVPMLGLARPTIIELSPARAVARLPLNRLNRNHVGSMYFGVLVMGAELSIALKAVELIFINKAPANFIFKDFKCEFKKRAEGAVDFCCPEVGAVAALLERAVESGERVEQTFHGYATPAGSVDNPASALMTYSLTLSIKGRTT